MLLVALEFYWMGHKFEIDANLAIKYSLKKETYEGLPGEKFRNFSVIFYRLEKTKLFLVWKLHIGQIISIEICFQLTNTATLLCFEEKEATELVL